MIQNIVQKRCKMQSIVNKNGGPKLMQIVLKSQCKRNANAKSTLEIKQNIFHKQCKTQSKMNENCTPMQDVVQK